MNKKIVTVVGARPQFIKVSPVSKQLKKQGVFQEILIHTGQHYDSNMSDVFFQQLEIDPPAYHLGIGSASHGEQTGKMLAAIETILIKEKPDWLLCYGDTNSTLAAALAASKLHIPIAHVEAGLRSFNKKMPEEINRVVTDHVSTLLFTPTQNAIINLQREGIEEHRIADVGDVMYDVALLFADKAQQHSNILAKLKLINIPYVLATVHRAENTDDLTRIKNIIDGLLLVQRDIKVVLPLHPRTRRLLQEHQLLETAEKLCLIEPVDFLDMIQLEKNAQLIVTDSGGVQKEAYFYRKPCVTLRDETEWVELVNSGWNTLVSPNDSHIISQTISICINKKGDMKVNLYRQGNAAELIVKKLLTT